jgi:hypothetical protein
LVRTPAEDSQTDQQRHSTFLFDSGRAHFAPEPTLLRRKCQDQLAITRGHTSP